MTSLPKLFALRNNDVRDKHSYFNVRFNSIIVPTPINQTKCNRANFRLLFIETASYWSSERLQLVFQARRENISDLNFLTQIHLCI